ncbi:hypothetical protein EKE94_10015 [Mesobaculum littorinae]|uniref:Lipoprotein n=1 Tax=Mesobaculum littorinae TaxID=2486419 RepID=A0A438AGH3_9RHOB|nr:hypothetical protein [Mesobaculum littorinae]RVV97810.1 hypothetical protein EKE94_10015 [Mesobaculum littorinae]
MPLRLFLCLVFLAACDAAGPGMAGADRREVSVDGSQFTVHRKGTRVVSYRTSRELMPSREGVLMKAAMAIERATGCPVAAGSLTGDQGKQRARLDCAG